MLYLKHFPSPLFYFFATISILTHFYKLKINNEKFIFQFIFMLYCKQYKKEAEEMFQILVVEDDRSTRMLMKAVLSHGGYEVFEAEDGLAALEVDGSAAYRFDCSRCHDAEDGRVCVHGTAARLWG